MSSHREEFKTKSRGIGRLIEASDWELELVGSPEKLDVRVRVRLRVRLLEICPIRAFSTARLGKKNSSPAPKRMANGCRAILLRAKRAINNIFTVRYIPPYDNSRLFTISTNPKYQQ